MLGDNLCLECTKDHYCPSPSVTPLACPMNSSSAKGSASVHDCLCIEGLVLVHGQDSYMCAECYADAYYARDQETSVGICVSCPANTGSQQDLEANETVSVTQDLSSESSGAYNSYTCTACSAGTFSITTNSSRCDSCVSGKFSASGGACRMELLVEKFELDVVEFFKTKFTGE